MATQGKGDFLGGRGEKEILKKNDKEEEQQKKFFYLTTLVKI